MNKAPGHHTDILILQDILCEACRNTAIWGRKGFLRLRMRYGRGRRALSWCSRRRRGTIWGLIGRLRVPMVTAAVVGATPKCGARFRILTPHTITPNARARPTTVKQGLVAFEVKK